MNNTALKNIKESPILVIDKQGVVGEAIAHHFSKEFLVVLVSESLFSKNTSNVLHIPFKKKIPEVPDSEYSKIFIVDDGSSVTRESAFSFINKALENNAPLYFIGSIRNVDVEHADDIVKSYDKTKVLLFGDLFDNALVFDKNSSINKYIYSVRSEQKIEVVGSGLSLNFPITFSDTIKLIIKATELELAQKIILLFSGTPITDISLANEFKKINPLIKVEIVKGQKSKKVYIPNGAMHALDRYDLKNRIESLSLSRVKIEREKNPKQKNKSNSRISYILLALLFAVFVPLISTCIFIFAGNMLLDESANMINKGSLGKANNFSNYSIQAFYLSEKTGKLLGEELRVLRLNKIYINLNNKILAGEYLSSAANNTSKSLIGFDQIYRGTTSSPLDQFSDSSNLYKNGMNQVEKSQTISSLPSSLSSLFGNLGFFSDLLSNSQDGVLNFLGFEGQKKYLVIDVDNKNLNSLGGSIGAAKIIYVKNGRIIDAKNLNVGDFLKNEQKPIEFPFFIKRYAGIKNPVMANSIFKTKFLENARNIESFYNSANSQQLDGVIAVNKETLSSLASETFFNSIKIFGKGLISKNILISVDDDDLQKVFDSKGWGGGVYDTRPSSSSVINDYLGIIETNLNNKADNNRVSKTVSKKIKLSSSGSLFSTITIAVNNSDSNSYKSYLQFLLPTDSSIIEIKINGIIQKTVKAITDEKIYGAKNFVAPKGLEVDEQNDSQKNISGFVVDVAGGGVTTISLTYQLQGLADKPKSSFNYSLGIYKQAGAMPYSLNLSFQAPIEYQFINKPKQLDFVVDQDKSLGVTLSQK